MIAGHAQVPLPVGLRFDGAEAFDGSEFGALTVLDVQAGSLDERKRMAGLVVAGEPHGDLSHRRWSAAALG